MHEVRTNTPRSAFLLCFVSSLVRSFTPPVLQHSRWSSSCLGRSPCIPSVTLNIHTAAEDSAVTNDSIMDTSTLTLLEHVNLNVPNHDHIVPFYVELLGCGLDPRKAENLLAGSKTVWANCGASQFHLPFGETAQVIPGHVGLSYDSLEPLQKRLQQLPDDASWVQSFEVQEDSVKVVDPYGNVFVCREGGTRVPRDWKQPLVQSADTERFQHLATKYGCNDETECRGISHVEFHCPVGTADKIALFYDSVLDATTCVLEHDQAKIAMIAFGNVDSSGRASQSLLFRETSEPIPDYDGHHVAMYVGTCAKDFEQAFQNAQLANVVWVNPRFSDKAHTLQGAKQWKQFRFKDIVDMETGKLIFTLEHEMRSVEHSSWPGPKMPSITPSK